MGAFFSDLMTQMKAIWARLDGPQRLTVSAVVLAAAVGVLAIIWVSNRPSYVVIHTATSASDLQEAQQALNQAGVSFEPASGMSLSVERSSEAAASAALFAAGLKGASSSMDMGNEMSDLTADSKMRQFLLDQKRRKTALDQILALDGVQDAKITAQVPKRRVFANEAQAQPKGSVILTLRRGGVFQKLAPAAAEFLSSAVEVPMEAIVVVNSRGGTIWRANPDRGSEYTITDFEELQRQVARNKTEMALAQLDAIYEGKARVTVNVELDPEWETRREDILPPEPVIIEQETTKDSTENINPGSGDPSLSGVSAGAVKSSGNTSSNETKKTKYYGKVGDLRRGRLAPDIKRMTCAVVLHTDLEGKRADIENIIKAAIGWDDTRDPTNGFSVLVEQFEVDVLPEVSDGPGIMHLVEKWAPSAIQLIGVVLVLMFLRGLMKKPKPKPREDTALLALAETPVEEEDLTSDQVARRMRSEIERVIGEDPAAVSKMVESWLSEVKA